MPEIEAGNTEAMGQTCFVARQPILNSARRVFGYELLFRSGPTGGFTHEDGDLASLQLIASCLTVFGLDALTGTKRAFINFTRGMLVRGQANLLPAERVVIELLETVEPDGEVVEACRKLRGAGYLLALDDFTYHPRFEPLISLADFIKVDFRGADPHHRREYAERFARRGITLLAEKVETWEEHREAEALGYTLFQGYFFCRPETLARKALAPSRLTYFRVLEALHEEEAELRPVAHLIAREPALAMKLLSYLNSALFGRPNRITSILHAAELLGPRHLRRWVGLLAVLGLCDGKPPELFVTCIVRARFCELIGQLANLPVRPFDLFLTGLLSAADALLGCPIEEALSQFAMPPEVQEALLMGTGLLAPLCTLMRGYECGDWNAVALGALALGVRDEDVTIAYQRSLAWADEAGGLGGSADQQINRAR